jgi:hypothetical protein
LQKDNKEADQPNHKGGINNFDDHHNSYFYSFVNYDSFFIKDRLDTGIKVSLPSDGF